MRTKIVIFLLSLNFINAAPFVLPFEDPLAKEVSLAGGKGASLATLREIPGIEVPEGFVITAEVYERFMQEGKIPDEIREEIGKAYALLGEPTVAVRSSAIAEDLPEASFAGQHDTFLSQTGIDAVIQSVIDCYASLLSEHAVAYRKHLHLEDKVAMAVVVQRMVDGSAAGVGFTVDMEGNPGIYIEANYGLGESVVASLASPDSWLLDPAGQAVIKSRLGEKARQVIGSQEIDVPLEKRSLFCLKEGQVLELAKKIRNIGETYKKQFGHLYVDTEFVFDQNEKLYFVQARPETVFSQKPLQKYTGVKLTDAEKGEILFDGGISGYPKAASGRLVVADSLEEARKRIKQGDILVTPKTTPAWSTLFPKLGGVIVDIGGNLCHTAIVGRELQLPTILATSDGTKTLKPHDGKIVTIDALNNLIYLHALPLEEGNKETFLRKNLPRSAREERKFIVHRIDEEGEWIRRSPPSLGKFQLEFYIQAIDQLAKWFHAKPIVYKIVDNTLFVRVRDTNNPGSFYRVEDNLLQWDPDNTFLAITDKLEELSLSELETLLTKRQEVFKNFVDFADRFEITERDIQEFTKLYPELLTHIQLRWLFGGALMDRLQIPLLQKGWDLQQISAYLTHKYPITNESDNMRHSYAELLKEFNDSKITEHARLYDYTDGNLKLDLPIDQIRENLLLDLVSPPEQPEPPPPLSEEEFRKMEKKFQKHPRAARIFTLGYRLQMQKENEHHLLVRSLWKVRDKLLAHGEALVLAGKLEKASEIFDLSAEGLLKNNIIEYTKCP